MPGNIAHKRRHGLVLIFTVDTLWISRWDAHGWQSATSKEPVPYTFNVFILDHCKKLDTLTLQVQTQSICLLNILYWDFELGRTHSLCPPTETKSKNMRFTFTHLEQVQRRQSLTECLVIFVVFCFVWWGQGLHLRTRLWVVTRGQCWVCLSIARLPPHLF